MHKFHALYTNEMIKISRKVVVLIVLVIMLLGVAGFGGIMKIEIDNMTDSTGNINEDDWSKEEMRNQLNYYKDMLATVEQNIKSAETEEEKNQLEYERAELIRQVDLYQMAVDNGINLYSGGFKASLLNEITSLKAQLQPLESVPATQRTKEQKAQIASIKETIEQFTAIVGTGDFSKYIEIKNAAIAADTSLSNEEKQLKTETNLLWLELAPTGEAGTASETNMLQSTLSQIENYKRSLLYNIDYSSSSVFAKPLTPDARQEVENNLAVLQYKAKHQLLASNYNAAAQVRGTAVTGMFGFGVFMMVCLMLILAGGAVSQEMSTGSIKSLIISPTKRYKIYFAKLASLVTVGVFSALVLYAATMAANGVYFGFDSGTSYVFAVNGVAAEMNFYLYRFAYLFVNFIDVLVYMMLAFMLSIITRNTAVSVGVSIAVYFGGSLANTFISMLAKGEWVKFIPFNNLSLASRIFPDSIGNTIGNIFGTRAVVPSLTFSIAYLAVLLICMGYIGLDSFNRRDIK